MGKKINLGETVISAGREDTRKNFPAYSQSQMSKQVCGGGGGGIEWPVLPTCRSQLGQRPSRGQSRDTGGFLKPRSRSSKCSSVALLSTPSAHLRLQGCLLISTRHPRVDLLFPGASSTTSTSLGPEWHPGTPMLIHQVKVGQVGEESAFKTLRQCQHE